MREERPGGREVTRRPATGRAALAALALACAALLTACGPTSSGPASSGPSGGGADDAQVQQMRQKVDAADSAAAQADENADQDN
ncbi:hypothetical protein GCM10009759_12920 [Kitasatospora saccharophila]|uniref:Small secreted protein n=1 Tax=Kitasatospora saccharophila TaxID=407973 RepID=A0ABN2WDP3_9ACTN